MNGTWKAIVGCVATLFLLGGLVVYLESRLPSEVKSQYRDDVRFVEEDIRTIGALQRKVRDELKKHPKVLRETADAEHWEDLIDIALADLLAVDKALKGEIGALVKKNSSDDQDQIEELLHEQFEKRNKAVDSVAHLSERVKKVVEILPRAAKAREKLTKALADDAKALGNMTKSIAALTKAHQGVDSIVTRERWVQHLKRSQEVLEQVTGEAEKLPQANTLEAAKKVLSEVDGLDKKRASGMAQSRRVETRLQALETYIQKRPTYEKQILADLEGLKKQGFDAPHAQALELAKRYPQNEKEIKRRANSFMHAHNMAIDYGKRALAEIKKPLDKANPASVNKAVTQLHKRRSSGPTLIHSFKSQLADLDRSYEKVLVDMEIKEGYEVTFHQEFLEVTAQHGTQAKPKEKRTWKKVSKIEYKKLENYLGLTVAFKPFGYFKHQTERKIAGPAGMSYVGNPAYGKWVGDHWIFDETPVTKALVLAAWGKHYPKHTKRDEASYSHRRKQWLGSDRWGHALYGSKGSLAKVIYANSRYMRNKGWVNTRYKRSGEKWRGSKYERRRRSSTVFVGGSRSSGSRSRSSWGSYGK